MSAEEGTGLSKSARKRANQKARAAAEAEAAEPAPAPAPAPKAKEKAAPKGKAAPAPAEPPAQPKAKAKGKAKAEPKAEPAPAPKAEPKAKGKAKAEPAPAPKEAEAPKAKGAAKSAAKASAKAGAKAKAKPEPEAPAKEKEVQDFVYEIDDGTGGAWEMSTGLDKKQQRQRERKEEKKKEEEAMKKAGVATQKANQHIPGLAPPEVQLAQAKGKAEAKAAPVGTIAVVTAAAAASKEKEPEKAAVVDNNVSSTVKVDQAKVGRVVGPKGANIIMIKEKTGVKTIDLSGDVCTIVGLPDAVTLAEHAVRQLIDKGYMSLAFDDFAEEGVQVHPSVFPDIIGSKGAVIQLIKKEAGVEVEIPPVPKEASTQPKKYKVGLAGSRAGVEKGKEILNSLVMYGHHEVTHPGFVHEEMEVEEWRYRFLIGSKGSEMRHIQNSFHVRVNIPRQFSANEKVVVIGERPNVDRAVKYIEKVLYEAEQPRGRGAVDKATDDWGDEGEEEAWMSPYMYRRK